MILYSVLMNLLYLNPGQSEASCSTVFSWAKEQGIVLLLLEKDLLVEIDIYELTDQFYCRLTMVTCCLSHDSPASQSGDLREHGRNMGRTLSSDLL